MDVESHAEHHGHRTGHKTVDMVVAFSALFISLVSLGVAIHHGHTMKTMADANARLVSANSWPFLAYYAGSDAVNGIDSVFLSVSNNGVGPAKIQSVELLWKDHPYRSNYDFLQACCGLAEGSPVNFTLLTHQVLPAGQSVRALDFEKARDANVAAAIQKVLLSRDVKLRVCYCSIFDECWKSELTVMQNLQPVPTAACDVPAIPLDQGVVADPD